MIIVKVPFSGGGLGKAKGCEKAPDVIVDELENVFSSETGSTSKPTIEEVRVYPDDFDKTHASILEFFRQHPKDFVMLGGDHSITFSSFKAFAQSNADAALLVFDAHPDMMEGLQTPSHEDYLRKLIDDGVLKKSNLVIVGIRNWYKDEFSFLKGIRHYTAKELFDEGIKGSCDSVMSAVKDFKSLYVSIDIDVLDAAFAPGTGYSEPGGLSSRELLYFIQRLLFLKNIKAFDLVEVNPDKDIAGLTVKTAAKILRELIG